jgi:LmbE family N-acetylglucosaminyl deacetylase
MDSRFMKFCDGSSSGMRTLVVAAHQDDETIGAGIRMSMLPEILLVHATDGAPRDPRFVSRSFQGSTGEYGAVRRRELEEAMEMIGVTPERMQSLDLPDLETIYMLPELARGLQAILRDFRPEVIITHAYEGGHPDHDATALALHAAVLLAQDNSIPPPLVLEMTSYYRRYGQPASGDFLQPARLAAMPPAKFAYHLNGEEIELKRRMLDCFRTQLSMLERLRSPVERFRIAPRYDFTLPPHAGPLHYEFLGWPITGEIWREHAAAALVDLGLGRVV